MSTKRPKRSDAAPRTEAGSRHGGNGGEGQGDVARRLEQLRDELRRHSHLYYVESRPEVDDAEYREALEPIAASSDSTLEEVAKTFEASGQEVALRSDILRRKAIERLVETASPVDSDGNPVDLTPIEIDETDQDESEQDEPDDEGETADGETPEVAAEIEE